MASLDTLDGKILQAESLEMRTGIPLKEMQGIRAWKDEESGKFGLEILHKYKAGRFGKNKPQWHRFAMEPREGGPAISYEKAQAVARHMDPFVRDADYEAPKEKRSRTAKPKKQKAEKPAPKQAKPKAAPKAEKPAKSEGKSMFSGLKRFWPKQLTPGYWAAIHRGEDPNAKDKPVIKTGAEKPGERKEPYVGKPAETDKEEGPLPETDELIQGRKLVEKLARTANIDPKFIQNVELVRGEDKTGENAHKINLLIGSVMGGEPAIESFSFDDVFKEKADKISADKLEQGIANANAYIKARDGADVETKADAKADANPAEPVAKTDAEPEAEAKEPKVEPQSTDAPDKEAAMAAIALLSGFPKKAAEELGIEEGPAWRDDSGTGHLHFRGIFAAIERMENGEGNPKAALEAAATSIQATKNPKFFVGDDAALAKVGDIGVNLAFAEIRGEPLENTLSLEELEHLTANLQDFTDRINERVGTDKAYPGLENFAATLATANAYYQHHAKNVLAPKLGGETPEPAVVKQPEAEPKAAPKAAETPAKDKGGDLPSFLKPGAKTMDERVAEHQAKKAAAKPTRETALMKAANAVLLKQQNIDIDDVLDADPSKVFEQIDALELSAKDTQFESVDQIKEQLKLLKEHRVAVRARHAFSNDNTAAIEERTQKEAPFYEALDKIYGKIDQIDPENVASVSIPNGLDGKNHCIMIQYKNDETAGPKKITVPYAMSGDVHAGQKTLDLALMRLREKTGQMVEHEEICHASQDFIKAHAKEHGSVQEEYKIDVDNVDDLGLIHFGDIMIGHAKPAGIKNEDLLGVNFDEENSALVFVQFDGSEHKVTVNPDKSIFRSGEDMAAAINRSLENERYMKAAAVQHTPGAEAA